MTIEVAHHNNIVGSNGKIPTASTERSPTPTQPAKDNIFISIIQTIYDVIVFLAISIGYILQVSFKIKTKMKQNTRTFGMNFALKT